MDGGVGCGRVFAANLVGKGYIAIMKYAFLKTGMVVEVEVVGDIEMGGT